MNNNFWQQTVQIGSFHVPRFMAAPLDGVTDSPLRQLIRKFSPEVLLFGEMRHVACVANEKEGASRKYTSIEHPISFQVSANSTEFIEQAVAKIVASKFDMLNLNLGCPARAVTRSGSGSALMADTDMLKRVLKYFRKVTEGVMPFTVKIRAGFKKKNALEVAQIAQDHGVECIIVHPRTAPEKFSSRLDFELVKQIKETVSIPVIFSGNVNNFARAQKTYERTGVDGVMIGRALWGCPWKIREIQEEARGNTFEVSTAQAVHYALNHLLLNFEHYGIRRGFYMFKKQLPQYIKGIENASAMRHELLRLQTPDEMLTQVRELCREYADDSIDKDKAFAFMSSGQAIKSANLKTSIA